MDLASHKKKFDKIIKKYGLNDDDKAEEVADFLTSHPKSSVSAEEFASLFAMTKEEAVIFLSFIRKGVQFKEDHIDGK